MPAVELAELPIAPPPTAPVATATPAPTERAAPGFARRLATRFALVAFACFHLPLFLNNYPSLGGGGFRDGFARQWGNVFGHVGIWVAHHVFGRSGPMPAGLSGDNGDTAEEYGRLLLGVVIAVLGSVIWTVADRRRPRARWVDEALRVLLRYSIALGLASYAVAKLYPQQFPAISPGTLDTRVGELSPFSLLWTFMQYSRVYSVFAGVMELAVVLLLCFRRTATLGALLCIPVMINVALMNWCYGVPVKLYSTITVLSAAVLVLYDARRVAAALFWHRSVPAAPLSPPFPSRRLNQLRWVVKLVVVGGVLVSSAVVMAPAGPTAAATAARPVFGTWDVTSFVVHGRDLAQTAEPARWRRFINRGGRASVVREDDTRVGCAATIDDAAHTLGLTCEATHQDGSFTWTRTGAELTLTGTFDHAPVTAQLKRRPESETPLLHAPFELTFD